MAKEEKKDEKAEKAEVSPEDQAAKSKKKKLLVIIIAGAFVTAIAGGGAAFFLAGGSKMAAKDEHAKDGQGKDEHGEGKPEAKEGESGGHGEGKKEEKESGHGEAKKEEKESGHGEAKKESKEGGHAEGKKEEKEGEHGEVKKGDKKDAKNVKLEGVDFGCTFGVQPFHLNLGNPLENRYVRLEIAVEYGCEDDTKAELDKRLPQLRDAVIAVTSRKTREFLLGPDGKEQLRKEIHNRINHYMSKKIDDVYITDILIE